MKKNELLKELKKASSKEVKVSYLQFGTGTNFYGVTQAKVLEIYGSVGKNHDIALQLWNSQVVEAQMLAIYMSNVHEFTPQVLDIWCTNIYFKPLTELFALEIVVKSPLMEQLLEKWSTSDEENVQECCWTTTKKAMELGHNLSEEFLKKMLARSSSILQQDDTPLKTLAGSVLNTVVLGGGPLAKKAQEIIEKASQPNETAYYSPNTNRSRG